MSASRALKSAARAVVDRIPALEPPARALQFHLWRASVTARSRFTLGDIADPHKTIEVATDDITEACVWPEGAQYAKFGERGTIQGGDWDLSTRPFTDLDVYQSFVAHFVRGEPWERTPYYHRVLAKVLSGMKNRGMETRADFDERCAYLDRLFESIRRDGYKPTTDLRGQYASAYAGPEDEVSVRIGRHGALLFEDGRHRLAIAKIVGVPRIPIKVTVRHVRWFALMQQVYAASRAGRLSEPVAHPDLADVEADLDWARVARVEAQVRDPAPGARAVVLGARWGLLCQRLEARGYECVGVEPSPTARYFAGRLRQDKPWRYRIGDERVLGDERSFALGIALGGPERVLADATDGAARRRLRDALSRLRVGRWITDPSPASPVRESDTARATGDRASRGAGKS